MDINTSKLLESVLKNQETFQGLQLQPDSYLEWKMRVLPIEIFRAALLKDLNAFADEYGAIKNIVYTCGVSVKYQEEEGIIEVFIAELEKMGKLVFEDYCDENESTFLFRIEGDSDDSKTLHESKVLTFIKEAVDRFLSEETKSDDEERVQLVKVLAAEAKGNVDGSTHITLFELLARLEAYCMTIADIKNMDGSMPQLTKFVDVDGVEKWRRIEVDNWFKKLDEIRRT